MAPLELPRWPDRAAHLPILTCQLCGGSGWNPSDPERFCPMCHGYRGYLNLPWRKPAAPKAKPSLTPDQVCSLRTLGCAIADYPALGTPAWDAFVQEYEASRRAKFEAVRAKFVEKWGMAPRHRRRRR